MYKLRNETKNERVRNSLDELTCYLENSGDIKLRPAIVAATTTKVTTPPPKTIRQSFTPTEYEDEEDPLDEDDEYLYDQQENSSNSLPVTQQEDPYVRHLFQIPEEELPCPRSLHAPTETTNRIEGTPPPDFPFMLSSNSRTNKANHFRPTSGAAAAAISITITALAFVLFT